MSGQFVKKAVDIEALMAQAAALEAAEKEAQKAPPPQEKKVKKPKPPKPVKVKKEKEKKVKKEKDAGSQKMRSVFAVPLEEVELDENDGMPEIWVTLISVLESYGKENFKKARSNTNF